MKEVVKALRKNAKGCASSHFTIVITLCSRDSSLIPHSVCVLAGDISPIDVLTHLPVLCEDKGIPYVYVPSKEVRRPMCSLVRSFVAGLMIRTHHAQELGGAGQTKRPTSCILIMQSPPKGGESDEETKEAYKKLHKRVKQIAPVF